MELASMLMGLATPGVPEGNANGFGGSPTVDDHPGMSDIAAGIFSFPAMLASTLEGEGRLGAITGGSGDPAEAPDAQSAAASFVAAGVAADLAALNEKQTMPTGPQDGQADVGAEVRRDVLQQVRIEGKGLLGGNGGGREGAVDIAGHDPAVELAEDSDGDAVARLEEDADGDAAIHPDDDAGGEPAVDPDEAAPLDGGEPDGEADGAGDRGPHTHRAPPTHSGSNVTAAAARPSTVESRLMAELSADRAQGVAVGTTQVGEEIRSAWLDRGKDAGSRADSDANATSVRRQVITQLARQDLSQVGEQKLTLQLEPEHLGKVDVAIQRTGDQLVVTFTASSVEAETALRRGADELVEAILGSQHKLTDVDIRTAQRDGQDRQEQKNDPDRRREKDERGQDRRQRDGDQPRG